MNLVRTMPTEPWSAAYAGDDSLAELRRGIDAIDDRIVALLNERARLARRVARVKAGEHRPVYDPDRERRVLDRLEGRAASFPGESIRSVYREVIRACRAVQEEPRARVAVAPYLVRSVQT